MVDRLKFTFTRVAKETATGEITVDVLDPTDSDEIAQKLKDRQFSKFLGEKRELQNEEWSFQPVINEEQEREMA